MDFGNILHKAQKNEQHVKINGVRCYSTKFEPPKKEKREKVELSNNIKKFLARKEAEERQKQLEVEKKRQKLLNLRSQDKKATRRVNVMLKRTKSANQSAIFDAIDNENTSVTLAGPMQPDEDDYGYVSHEAAAFYDKMMEKYSKIPEEPKFKNKKKSVSVNLASTKEKVIANLQRAKDEAALPRKRKRKNKEDEEELEDSSKEETSMVVKKKLKPLPPPTMNFNDLLKLAEKKQFEPIIIEPKKKEEEQLFTKKQRKEMEREKEWRDRREGRLPPLEKEKEKPTVTDKKIPKASGNITKLTQKAVTSTSSNSSKPASISSSKQLSRSTSLTNRENVPSNNPSGTRSVPPYKPEFVSKSKIPAGPANLQKPIKNDKQYGSNAGAKKIPPSLATKQVIQKDLKTRAPPPADVMRRKEFPPRDVKRKPIINNKRRILDDDEYDSEMDDFIDDGPEEEQDYSKYISEIFGYDKSKYRQADDDDHNMESTFAQQMREEVISTKIGIMEDLEDMKKEEEDKRRKALMKKKMTRK